MEFVDFRCCAFFCVQTIHCRYFNCLKHFPAADYFSRRNCEPYLPPPYIYEYKEFILHLLFNSLFCARKKPHLFIWILLDLLFTIISNIAEHSHRQRRRKRVWMVWTFIGHCHHNYYHFNSRYIFQHQSIRTTHRICSACTRLNIRYNEFCVCLAFLCLREKSFLYVYSRVCRECSVVYISKWFVRA